MAYRPDYISFIVVALSPGGPVHHSSDHYYSPPPGPKDDRGWSSHMDGYDMMVGEVSARQLWVA